LGGGNIIAHNRETPPVAVMSTTVSLILGALMLLLGRKLFWLFVGALGFLAGMSLAQNFLGGHSENFILIAGIALGLLGIVLAIFLQKVAIGAAGFFAGGYVVMNAAAAIAGTSGTTGWILFAAGGIAGALLLSLLFDWALIVFSSLVGAILISQSLHLHNTPLLVFVLALAGVLVQARFRRSPKSRKAEES
jgi:MFS family permease